MLALRPESLRRAGRGRTVTTLRGERGRIRTVTVPPLALERLSRIRPADPSRGFFAAPDRADPVLEQVRAAFEELARHLGISLRPQLLRDPGDIIALDRDVTAAQVAELLRRAPSGGGEDHAPARRAGRASAHAPAPRSDRRHRRSPATPSVPGRIARRGTGGRGSSAGRD